METTVLFHAVGVKRNDGDVRKPRFIQRTTDKGHIVAGAATATGLAHDDSQFIGIIATGKDSLHNLTNHSDRGETGVIVDVFQTHINSRAVVVVQHLNAESVL